MRILSCLLLSVVLLTTCCTPLLADTAVYLPKGSTTPFDGYLIDQEKADKVRNNKIDLDTANKIIESYKNEELFWQERLKNSRDSEQAMAKRLVDMQDNSVFSKVGYFVLGAAAATLVAYGAARAVR